MQLHRRCTLSSPAQALVSTPVQVQVAQASRAAHSLASRQADKAAVPQKMPTSRRLSKQ
jgi:hypothetical protein